MTGGSSAGELVVIDFGCIVDGYCSDMTRTVSVGDPGPEARRVWDVVRESQSAGREAVRAGVDCAEVDRACRDVIVAAGWGDSFVHGTGHGVGLEIHEDPRVAASARDTLEPGSVVTVEPGVYLPGVGGVRIEDTVVVTPDGSDPLTEFPKELICEPACCEPPPVSISTNDLKNGMALNLPSEGLVTVVEFQHVKPGKGGAFVRTKLKKVAGGAVLERTFRADEKVPLAVIDKREMQYLYREGDALVFMDNESYDQLNVAHVEARERRRLPQGGRRRRPAHVRRRRRRPPSSRPRSSSASAETEPGVQGDRVSGARKPATLETGLVVQVPVVRRTGRADQGRHPHRGIPGARLTPMAVTGSRREARERALGLCYELEVRDLGVDTLIEQQPAPPDEYAEQLVRGVEEHHADVDALLRKFSEHWALERMPAVDRAVLRLAAYELGWEPDIPSAVVISEAVELAKQYSTKDSGRFVNGLLSRIAEELRPTTG